MSEESRRQSFVRSWWPVLVWMGVIFLASTDLGSAAHTSRFLTPLLKWLRPGITREQLEFVHFLIRKAAHLTEYAILAVLSYRSLVRVFPGRAGRAPLQLLFLAAGLCACYASLDEFHQSFVSSRGASAYDVMIDTCGALLGLGLFRGLVLLRLSLSRRQAV